MAGTATERWGGAAGLRISTQGARCAPPVHRTAPSINVLIVDDENLSCLIVGNLLRKCGYTSSSCRSGREAIEILKDTSQTFDLILTDVVMPDIDGISLLKLLRADKNLHQIPVIMMSANEHSEMVLQCLQAGADDYLLKPVTKKELLYVWQHVWRKKHAAHAVPSVGKDITVSRPLPSEVPMLLPLVPLGDQDISTSNFCNTMHELQPPRSTSRGFVTAGGDGGDAGGTPKSALPRPLPVPYSRPEGQGQQAAAEEDSDDELERREKNIRAIRRAAAGGASTSGGGVRRHQPLFAGPNPELLSRRLSLDAARALAATAAPAAGGGGCAAAAGPEEDVNMRKWLCRTSRAPSESLRLFKEAAKLVDAMDAAGLSSDFVLRPRQLLVSHNGGVLP
eukprot:CAMPEP_0182858220 /NCGR_PEP_ID=MMETSP0034_2-20130328/3535_1 /TAXON_ID=156128 /ORGANISM="Nephroselmis pyriformis, Strain CCMP717" /LENGTH=393 /DNA_ID=CAMNT_0024989591 /DNA_START=646 /DNA_END=1824 /DNA_ORIENTATION=-